MSDWEGKQKNVVAAALGDAGETTTAVCCAVRITATLPSCVMIWLSSTTLAGSVRQESRGQFDRRTQCYLVGGAHNIASFVSFVLTAILETASRRSKTPRAPVSCTNSKSRKRQPRLFLTRMSPRHTSSEQKGPVTSAALATARAASVAFEAAAEI